MTDTERAFLLAASAAPADDLLRLVYSDWLEEQPGDDFAAHAEFVRLQVARAQLVRDDPSQPVARRGREKLLEQKFRRKWNGRVHRLLHQIGASHPVDARHGGIRGWGYSRGMIGSLTLTADAMIDLFWAVPQLGPVRRVVGINWPPADLDNTLELFFGPAGPKILTFAPKEDNDLVSIRGLATRVPILDLRLLPAMSPEGWSFEDVIPYTWRESMLVGAALARMRIGSVDSVRVCDPRGIWPQYRAEFAELTGFTDDPPIYQPWT